MNRDRAIFEDLFVLELANNHWGRLDRGLRIIQDFSRIVRFNSVRAAIKLQFRDVDAFIHKDFRDRHDIRYIKKTLDTRLTEEAYATLVEAIRKSSCIPMVTPFDEASVAMCERLGIANWGARADAQSALLEAAQYLERIYSECNSYILRDASTTPPCTTSVSGLPTSLRVSPREGKKRYDITVTEQIELGDGRVFLAGAARRSRPGGRGFATPFGAVVTMRDGLIRSIQTSSHAQAVRREAGLGAQTSPVSSSRERTPPS